jgi:hypothetical protein
MTAARAIAERHVDLLDAFTERVGARAYLWAVGEYELHEAVDKLQFDAEHDDLVDRIGQDAVQMILADAFQQCREEIAAHDEQQQQRKNCCESGNQHAAARSKAEKHGPAASMIEAFKYLVRQNNPEQLRAWLARRSAEEQAALLKMLVAK